MKEYERGKKLWDYFKCKRENSPPELQQSCRTQARLRKFSFKEYMELYLTCDVLILADYFESFRDLSLKHCGLDPAHYISSPGLSWDAMLKHTGIELE